MLWNIISSIGFPYMTTQLPPAILLYTFRYMLESDDSDSPLTNLTVKEFVKSVGSRTAVPGGGSVAALIGALVCLNNN